MSLKHGILGFLIYGVDNGYELNKAFEESVDNFWHATPSQIYRELDWLERNGMAESEVVIQSGKPNKKKYQITAQGRAMFQKWLTSGEEETIALRSAFLMRVFFSGLQSRNETVRLLREFEERCRTEQEMTKQWEQTIEHYRPMTGEDIHSFYWQLTADFGRRYMKMCEEWARDAGEKIRKESIQDECISD